MNVVTARHVKYAQGYLGLGLFNEAADELEAIEAEDRFLPAVMAVRLELYWESKQWQNVIRTARELVAADPGCERAWIGWAFALREVGQIAEAKAVLLEAEPRHGPNSALLQYNLGCYHCLLGELSEARSRLKQAFRMHPPFKDEAAEDPDLEALWAEL